MLLEDTDLALASSRHGFLLKMQFNRLNLLTKRTPFNTASALIRVCHEIRSEMVGDALSSGLYATDVSMYQMQPLAVAVPVDCDDTIRVIRQCREQGLQLLARSGDTQGDERMLMQWVEQLIRFMPINDQFIAAGQDELLHIIHKQINNKILDGGLHVKS